MEAMDNNKLIEEELKKMSFQEIIESMEDVTQYIIKELRNEGHKKTVKVSS